MRAVRRLHREPHRIAIHVVALLRDVRERDRALGLERVLRERRVAARRPQADRSPRATRVAGTEIVQPMPSAVALVPITAPSSSDSSAIAAADRRSVPLSDVRTSSVRQPAERVGLRRGAAQRVDAEVRDRRARVGAERAPARPPACDRRGRRPPRARARARGRRRSCRRVSDVRRRRQRRHRARRRAARTRRVGVVGDRLRRTSGRYTTQPARSGVRYRCTASVHVACVARR